MAVDAHAHLGEVVEVLGRAGDELLASLRDRLSGIGGLRSCEYRQALRDQITELAQQCGALGSWPARPGRESSLGGGNSRIDLGSSAARQFSEQLLCRPVDRFEIAAACCRLAIDEVIDLHLCDAQRPKCASPAMVFCRRPRPSISQTTSSPTSTFTAPSGVPVKMTSPALRVMNELRYSSNAGTSVIMSRVLPCWVSLPFTYVRRPRFAGSGTSEASTSQGPSTVAPSRFLTRRFGRYQFSR